MWLVPDDPEVFHVYVHVPRPVAGCHVWPLSVDTSTPPTTPPPVSLAVPLIVTWLPGVIEAFGAGAVIVDVGAVESLETVAAVIPLISVDGCTPMSANRLTVACCIRASAAALPRSWLESSPQDHCTVPAPNTRAPLGVRYSVMLWSTGPVPKFEPLSRSTGAPATVVDDRRNAPAGREPLSGSASHS